MLLPRSGNTNIKNGQVRLDQVMSDYESGNYSAADKA